jgi:hypothetical protein
MHLAVSETLAHSRSGEINFDILHSPLDPVEQVPNDASSGGYPRCRNSLLQTLQLLTCGISRSFLSVEAPLVSSKSCHPGAFKSIHRDLNVAHDAIIQVGILSGEAGTKYLILIDALEARYSSHPLSFKPTMRKKQTTELSSILVRLSSQSSLDFILIVVADLGTKWEPQQARRTRRR